MTQADPLAALHEVTLTEGERALAAWRAATLLKSDDIAARYLAMVDPADPALASLEPAPRLAAILLYVGQATTGVRSASGTRCLDLSAADTAMLSQILSCVRLQADAPPVSWPAKAGHPRLCHWRKEKRG